MRKYCSCDGEFFLKFKALNQEFAKILRSLEEFIQTMKDQNNFGNRKCFSLFLEVSQIECIRTIGVQIRKKSN